MNDNSYNFIEDLLIVMVIYQQGLSSSKPWNSLVSALPVNATLFLFDNSELSQEVPPSRHQVIYHFNSTNAGVAGAYNAGWIKAKQLGKPWILLLDQDTEISSQLFNAYRESIFQHPNIPMFAPILKDKLGILSPFYFNRGIARRLKKADTGVNSFENRRAANSGVLIKTIVFDHVNGFDERLPLDHSDIYFQEKIFQHHPSFVVIPIELNHQFSGSENQDFKGEVSRYKIFCESCVMMASLSENKNSYYRTSLKRAIRLSMKHFSTAFVSQHFQTWGRV